MIFSANDSWFNLIAPLIEYLKNKEIKQAEFILENLFALPIIMMGYPVRILYGNLFGGSTLDKRINKEKSNIYKIQSKKD